MIELTQEQKLIAANVNLRRRATLFASALFREPGMLNATIFTKACGRGFNAAVEELITTIEERAG